MIVITSLKVSWPIDCRTSNRVGNNARKVDIVQLDFLVRPLALKKYDIIRKSAKKIRINGATSIAEPMFLGLVPNSSSKSRKKVSKTKYIRFTTTNVRL
jgi:hypothetical protein